MLSFEWEPALPPAPTVAPVIDAEADNAEADDMVVTWESTK